MGAGSPRSVPAWLGSHESPLSSLIAIFSLCPHLEERGRGERWRERGGWEERERKTTLLANECSKDDVIGNSWRRGKKNNSELG